MNYSICGDTMTVLVKRAKSKEALEHKRRYDTKYESSPDRVKYREELNQERRQRGIMGEGGPDVSHTSANTVTLENPHDNRARHFKERGTYKPIEKAWSIIKMPRTTFRGYPDVGDLHYDYDETEPDRMIDGAEYIEGITPRVEQLTFESENDPMMQREPLTEGEQFRNHMIKKLMEMGDLSAWNADRLGMDDPHFNLYYEIADKCDYWIHQLRGQGGQEYDEHTN
tara:strand:- start:7527 stop:8204 length:678 start_codon:yes stop_codon:yes gene_type:complete